MSERITEANAKALANAQPLLSFDVTSPVQLFSAGLWTVCTLTRTLPMHTPAGKGKAGGRGGNGGGRPSTGGAGQRPLQSVNSPYASPPPAAAAASAFGGAGGAPAPSLTFSASKHAKSMRAQKAAGTQRAQSKTLFKPALASPFSMPWQPLSVDDSLQALQLLQRSRTEVVGIAAAAAAASTAAIAAASSPAAAVPSAGVPQPAAAVNAKLAPPPVRAPAKRKRNGDGAGGDVATDMEDDDEATAASSSSGLLVGINSVTRAAEQDQLSLLIVCRSVAPLALIAHLPLLCHLRRIPLLTLHQQVNTRMLAHALQPIAPPTGAAGAASGKRVDGVQLCMALGFKRGTPALENIVASLLPLASIPDVPWLAVPPVLTPVNVINSGAEGRLPKQKPKQQQQQKQQAGAGAAPAGAAAGDGNGAAGNSGAPAGRQRIESATQRRKKAKLARATEREEPEP